MLLHRVAVIVALAALIPAGEFAFAQATGSTAGPAAGVRELSLDEALAIARERSFRVARSTRSLDAAEARHRAANAAYYPRFDSYALLQQTQRSSSGDQFRGLHPQAIGALNLAVTQPIDVGGVIGRQVRQSEISRRSTGLDVETTDLDVVFEVENAYFNALRVQGSVEVDESVVASLEKLHQASLRANSPSAGFLEVELANARQNLVGGRTFLDLSLDQLKLALRLAPETTVRLTTGFGYRPEPFDDAQLYRRAIDNRPELRQTEARIEQSRIAAEQVYDSRKPFFNLSLFHNNFVFGHTVSAGLDRPLIYDRGVQLTLYMPLAYWDWGVLRENRRAALTQVDQSLADLEEQKERLSSDLRQTLIALRRAEQRIQTLPSRSKAVEGLEAAEKAFLSGSSAAGQAALAQMSNARVSLRSTETAAIEAFADYALARARLRRLLAEKTGAPVSK